MYLCVNQNNLLNYKCLPLINLFVLWISSKYMLISITKQANSNVLIHVVCLLVFLIKIYMEIVQLSGIDRTDFYIGMLVSAV